MSAAMQRGVESSGSNKIWFSCIFSKVWVVLLAKVDSGALVGDDSTADLQHLLEDDLWHRLSLVHLLELRHFLFLLHLVLVLLLMERMWRLAVALLMDLLVFAIAHGFVV
ncbi:hypothetical protein Ancab_002394 [Ancistrocladus abbreviatus]